jgi:anti-sigma regulatory factor (Ser/Thr protein kinase)
VTTADRTPGGTASSRSSEVADAAVAYTEPAVVFRYDGPEPTVVGVNAALGAVVDGVDDSLPALLDRVTDHDGETLAAAVVDPERLDTVVRLADDDRRFLPRVVRATDDGLGHLLFVELPTAVTASGDTGGDATGEATHTADGPTSETNSENPTSGTSDTDDEDSTGEPATNAEDSAGETTANAEDSAGEGSADTGDSTDEPTTNDERRADGDEDGDEEPEDTAASQTETVPTDGGVATPGDDCDGVDDSEAVAHVVSHDLRNPLDVAAAHLELARDERDGEHLRRVAEAHERMEQIIRDVLTLARGERAISPSEGVDLGAVVTDAWDSIAADDVELSVSGVPTATADRPRVERLVENLLRNAVDHAGPAPTIYAGGLPDDAGFYVADDGDGVPTDVREAVFEPGYTESGDGTGLGLAIVRRIAAAHGWSVRLADSDAGGARVEVWFDDPPEETA